MRQPVAVLFLSIVALGLPIHPPAAFAQSGGGGPTVGYTADFKIQDYGGPKMRGRVYGMPGKERRETPDSYGGTTLILRYDLGVAWTILPGGRQFIETPLRAAGSPPPAPGAIPPGLARLEDDDINDVPATKYAFPPTNIGPGGEIWLSREGIALRIDGRARPGGSEVRFELDNLAFGPQNPTIFELPPGAQKAGQQTSSSTQPPPGSNFGGAPSGSYYGGQRPPNSYYGTPN